MGFGSEEIRNRSAGHLKCTCKLGLEFGQQPKLFSLDNRLTPVADIQFVVDVSQVGFDRC